PLFSGTLPNWQGLCYMLLKQALVWGSARGFPAARAPPASRPIGPSNGEPPWGTGSERSDASAGAAMNTPRLQGARIPGRLLVSRPEFGEEARHGERDPGAGEQGLWLAGDRQGDRRRGPGQ